MSQVEADFAAELAAMEQELVESSSQDNAEVPNNEVPISLNTENNEISVDPTNACEDPVPSPAAPKPTTTTTAATAIKSLKKKPLLTTKKSDSTTAPTSSGAAPPAPLAVKKYSGIKSRLVDLSEQEEQEEEGVAKPTALKKSFLVSKPTGTTLAVKLKKTPATASKKITPAATTTAATGPTIKRNKNAYMFFSDANRKKVLEETPSLSMGEVSKILGEQWKSLPEADKKIYRDQSEEDKVRFLAEQAAGGVLAPARKSKAKNESTVTAAKGAATTAAAAVKKTKKKLLKPKKLTSFEIFSNENRPFVKKENPKAGILELNKLLTQAWSELSDEEKAPYAEMSKELNAAATAAAAAAQADEDENEDEEEEAETSARKRAGGGRGAPSGRKRARKSAAADGGSDADDDAMEEADEDDDEEIDRENVDWEAHPATAILSKTKTKYIVSRCGLPLSEYGIVPISVANMQRAGQRPADGTPACPLSVEMLNEYDDFLKTFKKDFFDSFNNNEIDFDHLREGHLLEACSFLGDLRTSHAHSELNHIANKKEDAFIRVSAMGISRLVQRLLMVERRKTAELQAQLDALLANGSGSGKVAGVTADDVKMAEA